MQTETNDWQAFNLATDALRDIDRFVSSTSKDRAVLVAAREKLTNAVKIDPEFSRAQYYGAIVDDMLGKSKNAVDILENLIASQPAFKEEAQYNLGVSYYHLYSQDKIDKAITAFRLVARQTSSSILKYMANAGLVRSYGMMVLHNKLDHAISEEFFKETTSTSDELLATVKSDPSLDKKTRVEIQWRTLNGRGVGRMFYSDDQADSRGRKTSLELSQNDFEKANKLSSNNWEIVCNLGSVHMRLGVVAKLLGETGVSIAEFAKARDYLQDVIDRIRPNYGFALWELGRVYRFSSKFADAKASFERALQIPDDERNISQKSVYAQIDKANSNSDIFP